MKRRAKLFLLITMTLFVSISCNLQTPTIALTQGAPFQDIGDSYAKTEIAALYRDNIMAGVKPGFFAPKQPMTRAQFLTTLVRLLRLTPVQAKVPAYSDVASSSWYYGYIQAATEIGLASGTGAGTFSPDRPLSRQEAAAWIVRAFKQQPSSATALSPYRDQSEIAPWALPYVNTVTKLQFMGGYERMFQPNQPLSRQEAASLLYRIQAHKPWMDEIGKEMSPKIQIGWQYGQTTQQYEHNVLNSNVNVLSPRWFFLEKGGKLQDYSDPSLITWAKQQDKAVWAMLGNRFDMEATHELLASSAETADFTRSIVSTVQKYGLQGINVDFENVKPEDRPYFTRFIKLLGEQMHSAGAVLSVNVSPELGSDWTAAFDYAAIGKYADYVVLMGYDEHWAGGSYAGSVSSLPWVRSGLDTLRQDVPDHKLILALPFYNRDWTTKGSSSNAALASTDITLQEQTDLMVRYKFRPIWNENLGQYNAAYTSGAAHRLWLEDSRSLSLKYQMAASRGIAGYAYWHIGGETPDVWTSLSNAERYSTYLFHSFDL
ncbi:S-layer homology domain-containing protein [Paenibacillus woosongensis]|uniref:S-layer homology domain-containing protein n=1 Tax=Paenibacillus woosongensis TaxID=307580 RepID=A0AA95L1C5_9BACL|nr:S-layer homology domain-containing protein [Paenibacillus woosongensis]WHX47637.1 S-layer homology domain-containing protein [Paenibacillus woosongensis]